MGKEPELVFDTERYWLDIVGLTSLLCQGWTPSQSGSALGERQGGGVGILASPWMDDAYIQKIITLFWIHVLSVLTH